MNRVSTIASADDASHIQAALEMLSTRVDTFEHNLQQTFEAERVFRASLQTVSNALDAFVQTHVQEDELLTRLIEEDTQRSREAKERYDVLAARFEDSLRPHASTRRRELLKTVSLYIGIVLSVVFMAPLHLVLSLFEKLLFRMGYRRHDDVNVGYAEATARYRARQNWRRAANATRFSNTLRNRRRLGAAELHPERSSLSTSLRSTQSSSTHSSSLSLGVLPDIDRQLQAMHLDIPGASPQEDTVWLAESLAKMSADTGRNRRTSMSKDDGRIDGAEASVEENGIDSGDLAGQEDGFVDAKAGAGKVDGQVGRKDVDNGKGKDAEKRKSNGATTRGGEKKSDRRAKDESKRPDWARPFDDDHSPPETAKFPSADFWNISNDEIRIDLIKREDENPTEQS